MAQVTCSLGWHFLQGQQITCRSLHFLRHPRCTFVYSTRVHDWWPCPPGSPRQGLAHSSHPESKGTAQSHWGMHSLLGLLVKKHTGESKTLDPGQIQESAFDKSCTGPKVIWWPAHPSAFLWGNRTVGTWGSPDTTSLPVPTS